MELGAGRDASISLPEPLLLGDGEEILVDVAIERAAFDALILPIIDRSIDVVLTDIDMPGSMDGLMLAVAVRNRWPPVQIVVMSGKQHPTSDDLPSRARFLEKPLRCRKKK